MPLLERPTYTKREPSGGGIGGDLSGVLTPMELMEQPGGMGGRKYGYWTRWCSN